MIERIKDWSPVIALIAIFLLLMNLRGCDPSKPKPVVMPTRVQDSFRTVIKYQDSVRVHYITKWRNKTRLVDSSPCYTEVKTIIAECDTIIKVDSILIGSLKSQHSFDSTVIFNQYIRIKGDSAHIVKLDRRVKRNRRLALGLGAVLAGAVGVKLIP